MGIHRFQPSIHKRTGRNSSTEEHKIQRSSSNFPHYSRTHPVTLTSFAHLRLGSTPHQALSGVLCIIRPHYDTGLLNGEIRQTRMRVPACRCVRTHSTHSSCASLLWPPLFPALPCQLLALVSPLMKFSRSLPFLCHT